MHLVDWVRVWLYYIYSMFIVYLSYIYSIFMVCCSYSILLNVILVSEYISLRINSPFSTRLELYK